MENAEISVKAEKIVHLQADIIHVHEIIFGERHLTTIDLEAYDELYDSDKDEDNDVENNNDVDNNDIQNPDFNEVDHQFSGNERFYTDVT